MKFLFKITGEHGLLSNENVFLVAINDKLSIKDLELDIEGLFRLF